jgi:hypothetical protein
VKPRVQTPAPSKKEKLKESYCQRQGVPMNSLKGREFLTILCKGMREENVRKFISNKCGGGELSPYHLDSLFILKIVLLTQVHGNNARNLSV